MINYLTLPSGNIIIPNKLGYLRTMGEYYFVTIDGYTVEISREDKDYIVEYLESVAFDYTKQGGSKYETKSTST